MLPCYHVTIGTVVTIVTMLPLVTIFVTTCYHFFVTKPESGVRVAPESLRSRSQSLKRHMRKHRDLYSLNENDMREEIKERKRQHDNREERIRLAHEIAQQENLPLECIDEQKKKWSFLRPHI